MTPQELKNSILQQAIQGKLVEQRFEDGSAEELYQQIQHKRVELIKDKKIKKAIPLPEIAMIDIPFDIPKTWKWCRIGEIFNLKAGKNITAADIAEMSSPDSPFPCYGGNGLRGFVAQHNCEGDFNLIGRQGALCGNINQAKGKFYATEHAVVVDQFNLTDFQWATIFLKALNLNQYATATAQPGLAVANIIKILIPLPPLAEQKRIVAKIEELLPLVEKYEQAWAHLEELNKAFPGALKKSVLQQAIQGKLVEQRPEEGTAEELYERIQVDKQRLIKERKIKKEKDLPEITEEEIPFDIPDSWKWVRLIDCGSWKAGSTPSRAELSNYGGPIPWLKTGDLTDGFITETSENITEDALKKYKLVLQPINAVLMAMYGATTGKLGILKIEATTNQACCSCSPFRGVYNKYLFYFLMAWRTKFIKMGAGGAQPNISKEKIINTIFPLPPLAEQKRIVAKIEELLPLCEQLESKFGN